MVFVSVIITMVLWKIVNLGTTMYSYHARCAQMHHLQLSDCGEDREVMLY